jgi:hypothetical protein
MADKPKVHPLVRAWAAGVFDGKAVVPRDAGHMFMDSQDESLLRRFLELIGVGYLKLLSGDKVKTAPRWRWGVSNMDDCREAILFVAPFLSPQKTRQCADKLARIERNPLWRKRNPEKAEKLDAEASSAPSVAKTTAP